MGEKQGFQDSSISEVPSPDTMEQSPPVCADGKTSGDLQQNGFWMKVILELEFSQANPIFPFLCAATVDGRWMSNLGRSSSG